MHAGHPERPTTHQGPFHNSKLNLKEPPSCGMISSNPGPPTTGYRQMIPMWYWLVKVCAVVALMVPFVPGAVCTLSIDLASKHFRNAHPEDI